MDDDVTEKVEQFTNSKWPFIRWRLKWLPWKRPIEEIYYDWCTVRGYVNLIRLRLNIEKELTTAVKVKLKNKYTLAMAYLELARDEADPGQAWNLVNSADKLLPLVMDEEAFDRSLIRMRAWDDKLFECSPLAKPRLEALDAQYDEQARRQTWDEDVPCDIAGAFLGMRDWIWRVFKNEGDPQSVTGIPKELVRIMADMICEIQQKFRTTTGSKVWGETILKELQRIKKTTLGRIGKYEKKASIADKDVAQGLRDDIEGTFTCIERLYKEKTAFKVPAPSPPAPGGAPKEVPDWRRRFEYCKQANRAQLWYSVNSRLTLNYVLWKHYFNMFLVMSVVAIAALEFAYAMLNPGLKWWYRPFLGVWILGVIGATVSAKAIPRELVKDTTSVQLIKLLMSVRILTGGLGAIIVFLSIGSGMVTDPFPQLVTDNFLAFSIMGIASGFSEQLSVSALGTAVKKLELVGDPLKD